jgi:hypothetical protein
MAMKFSISWDTTPRNPEKVEFSEEDIGSIFKVEKYMKKNPCMKHVAIRRT